jgi:hypothetical protein
MVCVAIAGDFRLALALLPRSFSLCVFVDLAIYKEASRFSSLENFSYSLRFLYRLISILYCFFLHPELLLCFLTSSVYLRSFQIVLRILSNTTLRISIFAVSYTVDHTFFFELKTDSSPVASSWLWFPIKSKLNQITCPECSPRGMPISNLA